MVERAAAQVYRPSPPLSPASFDSAIAEIAARQNELDGVPSRQMPPRSAPPMAAGVPPMAPSAPAMAYAPPMQPPAPAPAPAPMPAGPDFSSLERHLLKITSQIEAMQRPDNVEQSIAAFRTELADIRRAITEAMPRQAIDSIENEIRSLSRRIDETRQNGTDANVLANLERALGEIYDALRSLKPAEQLAGYDDAIRNLGTKLDLILRSNDDPSTVRQLEDAISAMRAIASNVASNDALARVSDDLHALSAKVDQLSRAGDNSESLASLEQRIAALTSSIETRERPVASDNSEYIEGALRSLSERLDRIPAGNDNASAFTHLEQRVTYLLERLETSGGQGGSGGGNLGRVEEGLQDILRHLEHQHANLARLADNTSSYAAPQPMDSGIVEAVKRELSDLRFSQSETDRRTQESLETVHSTLGHVVDRLAMIEGDLRAVRAAPPVAAPAPAASKPATEAPRAAMPPPSFAPPAYVPQAQPQAFAPQPKPELPNPAASQEHFAAAPREFHAAEPVAPPAIPPMTPRAISEILEPHAAPPRTAIAPELPPDHPLEPGTRPTARASSPSERIAASESVINEISAAAKEPVSSSSFIAAARRAAQAAAAAPANEKAAKAAAKATAKAAKVTAIDKGKTDGKEPSNITSKIRSLLVGASVFVIVLSTFQMAMTLLDTGSAPQIPQMEFHRSGAGLKGPGREQRQARHAGAGWALDDVARPDRTAIEQLLRTEHAGWRASRYSPIHDSSGHDLRAIPQAAIPQTAIAPQAAMSIPPQAAMSPINAGDITGAIPALPANGKPGMVQVPPGEQLPDGIGGPMLRAAALKGDPTAAYEVGVRFAEGKGVAANLDEAAKWYDRAAQAGVVPAIFRLGTFYEKGMSVKKDADVARRYYLQAAERGNAKAMHNLAVLDADGGGKGANYKSRVAMVPQGGRSRRRRQPVQPRHPLCPRHRGRAEPRRILQMVQPRGSAGRCGFRPQA